MMEENDINRQRYDALLRRTREMNAQPGAASQKPGGRDYLITNPELMRLLQVSKATAQRWRNSGRLPFIKVEKKLYYRIDTLLELFGSVIDPPDEHGKSPPSEGLCPCDLTYMECARCPLFVALTAGPEE